MELRLKKIQEGSQASGLSLCVHSMYVSWAFVPNIGYYEGGPDMKGLCSCGLASPQRKADRLIAENSFPLQSLRIWFLEHKTFISYNSDAICFGNDCDLLSSDMNLVSSKMTLLVSCWHRKNFRGLLGAVTWQMITRSRVTSVGMAEVAPSKVFHFHPKLLKTHVTLFIWGLLSDLSYNDFIINSTLLF